MTLFDLRKKLRGWADLTGSPTRRKAFEDVLVLLNEETNAIEERISQLEKEISDPNKKNWYCELMVLKELRGMLGKN